MQNKKDQRSDIKNTLIVTLKTPGRSQVHKDNRNIQLLLKPSDIFIHLKHSWTLTAYYTWHTSTEESECEFTAIEWDSVTTSSNKQWTTSISSTISGGLAWGSEADAKNKKTAHKQMLLPSCSVFLVFTALHSVHDTLTNHRLVLCGEICAYKCFPLFELALCWATVSLHITYRTKETR